MTQEISEELAELYELSMLATYGYVVTPGDDKELTAAEKAALDYVNANYTIVDRLVETNKNGKVEGVEVYLFQSKHTGEYAIAAAGTENGYLGVDMLSNAFEVIGDNIGEGTQTNKVVNFVTKAIKYIAEKKGISIEDVNITLTGPSKGGHQMQNSAQAGVGRIVTFNSPGINGSSLFESAINTLLGPVFGTDRFIHEARADKQHMDKLNSFNIDTTHVYSSPFHADPFAHATHNTGQNINGKQLNFDIGGDATLITNNHSQTNLSGGILNSYVDAKFKQFSEGGIGGVSTHDLREEEKLARNRSEYEKNRQLAAAKYKELYRSRAHDEIANRNRNKFGSETHSNTTIDEHNNALSELSDRLFEHNSADTIQESRTDTTMPRPSPTRGYSAEGLNYSSNQINGFKAPINTQKLHLNTERKISPEWRDDEQYGNRAVLNKMQRNDFNKFNRLLANPNTRDTKANNKIVVKFNNDLPPATQKPSNATRSSPPAPAPKPARGSGIVSLKQATNDGKGTRFQKDIDIPTGGGANVATIRQPANTASKYMANNRVEALARTLLAGAPAPKTQTTSPQLAPLIAALTNSAASRRGFQRD